MAMTEKVLAEHIYNLGIRTVTGIPDSTLKQFCGYVQTSFEFSHSICANEGAAVGIAIGSYLATGRPACVYLQNSGLGNLVNPYTSLVHGEVYGIPMLLIIGWRGDDTGHDEPQHKFMGRATLPLLDTLEIPYAILNRDTTPEGLNEIFKKVANVLKSERAFALVVQRGTFEKQSEIQRLSSYSLTQEAAVVTFLEHTAPEDVIIATTGKISRELHEKLEIMPERRGQAFLTVGGMGFASSIAMGIALEAPDKRVWCLDGDGAVLMHMGTLAVVGARGPANLYHICLNNQAYESVGGMPTGVAQYRSIARACGYRNVWFADSEKTLGETLEQAKTAPGPVFLEVGLANASRKDLGRPKESAQENKRLFRVYHWKEEKK